MKLHVKVNLNKTLSSINEETDDYLKALETGQILSFEVKKTRNYKHLQKIMTLFNLVHDALPSPDPVEFQGKSVNPIHTMENTRKYLTVKAGYYTVNGFPDGSVRVEAKSLSFANMEQDEFDQLYSDVIDAALRVLPDTWDADKINQVANDIVRYG